MRYFDDFCSACAAGCGNQSFFTPSDPSVPLVARAFFRLEVGGEHEYSLLFSNIIDSTYADGRHSARNRICAPWRIEGARVCLSAECDCYGLPEDKGWIPLRFGGDLCRDVAPGEFFASDAITLSPRPHEYLCLELTFSGKEIPYHEESLLPIFAKEGDGWTPTKRMPLPGMIGCRRSVERRVGFIGDSITQGCGTPHNSYTHYGARIAGALGDRYSYWDLGLGYGRANDAASLGAWFYKAKHLDVITVCFGVNDILQGFSPEQTKKDLYTLVTSLKAAGVTVLLQTIPPFGYQGEKIAHWKALNTYILTELAPLVDEVFDVVPLLGLGGEFSHIARYGDHPNAEGHRVWSEALAPVLMKLLTP